MSDSVLDKTILYMYGPVYWLHNSAAIVCILVGVLDTARLMPVSVLGMVVHIDIALSTI